MDFNKIGGGSNNFIIWILLFVIVFGFGKCGNTLGFNLFRVNQCNDVKYNNRKHCKNTCDVVQPIGINNWGIGGVGGLFGGNILFIIVIIALLFICKDDKNEFSDSSYINADVESQC